MAPSRTRRATLGVAIGGIVVAAVGWTISRTGRSSDAGRWRDSGPVAHSSDDLAAPTRPLLRTPESATGPESDGEGAAPEPDAAVSSPKRSTGRLVGTVRSPTGEPVAGATVYVFRATDDLLRADPRLDWSGAVDIEASDEVSGKAYRGTSSADGSFAVVGLFPDREYVAVAFARRFTRSFEVTGLISTDVNPDVRSDVTLRAPSFVDVHVVDLEGRPVSASARRSRRPTPARRAFPAIRGRVRPWATSPKFGHCHNADSSIATVRFPLRMPAYASAAQVDEAIAALVARTTKWDLPDSAPGTTSAVKPGAPDLSALFVRMRSRRPSSQMPPLGTTLPDRDAIDLVLAWIDELGRRDVAIRGDSGVVARNERARRSPRAATLCREQRYELAGDEQPVLGVGDLK